MDEGTERLKRAVLADPTDADATRAYERALVRAGHRLEVTERYRFKFLCGFGFNDLGRTDQPSVRHCSDCDRDVHLVTSGDELAQRVAAGDCVAIDHRAVESAIEGLVDDGQTHSATEERAPCVVKRRPMKRGKIARVPRDPILDGD